MKNNGVQGSTHPPAASFPQISCMYVHTVLPRYFSSLEKKTGPALDRSINEKCNKNIKKLFFFFLFCSLFLFRHLSLPISSHLEITRVSLPLLRGSEGASFSNKCY